MQATGQNNSPNIIIRCHQEPAVSMVNRIENPVMTFRLVLLQSIAGQFYDNCSIVITQTIVQLIRVQRLALQYTNNVHIEESVENSCRYILLIRDEHCVYGILSK